MIKSFIDEVGTVVLTGARAMASLLRGEADGKEILKQMEVIGIESVPVLALTSVFAGMVLALNTFIGFSRFGAGQYTGSVVGVALAKELVPVLAGIVIAGRVGAAMAAELGTMKVTEQIDALYTLNAEPISYLVLPRLVASTIMLPVLVLLGIGVAHLGAYIVAVGLMGVNPRLYDYYLFLYMEPWDIATGLIKATSFGTIIALVGCHKGLQAEGGAEGVGKATTSAVVHSSIAILIVDFIWGKILPWTLRF